MKSKHDKDRTKREISKHMKSILELLGVNTTDPNYKGTPDRVARTFYEEMYPIKPTKKLFSTFPSDCGQMIILKDHISRSRCPHHLERVNFEVTVAYIPNGQVIGLSKLGRIPDYYSHGCVLQEQFTEDVADALHSVLKPKGVGVFVKGDHQCMQHRGLLTDGFVVTTALKGVFFEDARARQEFLMSCMHNRG